MNTHQIILLAITNCALRYCRNIPRGINLWDERLTYQQKSVEIAEEIERLGYRLLKTIPFEEDTNEKVISETTYTLNDGE